MIIVLSNGELSNARHTDGRGPRYLTITIFFVTLVPLAVTR
jgi:hypothetical protein